MRVLMAGQYIECLILDVFSPVRPAQITR